MVEYGPLKKELTTVQTVAVYCAHTLGLLTLCLAVTLAAKHNTGNDVHNQLYLGGLGGGRKKVFSWHPPLMVGCFGFCMTNALLSFRT